MFTVDENDIIREYDDGDVPYFGLDNYNISTMLALKEKYGVEKLYPILSDRNIAYIENTLLGREKLKILILDNLKD